VNTSRLIGHERAVRAFRGGLSAGRLAHAYLITGPPGVGRRTFAIRMAQELLCSADAPPCGSCDACRLLDDAHSLWRVAVRRGHPDEVPDPPASHGGRGGSRDDRYVLTSYEDLQVLRRRDDRRDIPIDGLRAFAAQLHLLPAYGSARIGLIDGAEEMNPSGENALLKTLEEPPAHALIVLIARRAADVLPTVRSRCRHIELTPAPVDEVAAHLGAMLGIAPDRAAAIAEASRGRVGWAVRMGRTPADWDEYLARRDSARAFEGADSSARMSAATSAIGTGPTRVQLDRAHVWIDALEEVQASALRASLRQNGPDVADEGNHRLRAAVRRLVRLRATRRLLMQNVTPRLACEDLAIRPEAAETLSGTP
jgi:DNA polymerase-3 subunit delta'